MTANAALKVAGVITPKNTKRVIDRSKIRIRRERAKVRIILQEAPVEHEIQCVCFDGKIDETQIKIKKGDKFHATRK